MNEIECETCIKRKTVYCPNHVDCYDTINKPYYQNRIMLLEKNKQLKEHLERYEIIIFNLKEQLEKSEKARKEAIELINNINDWEICSKYDCIYKDDILDVLRILDIDKGE